MVRGRLRTYGGRRENKGKGQQVEKVVTPDANLKSKSVTQPSNGNKLTPNINTEETTPVIKNTKEVIDIEMKDTDG